MRTTDLDSYHIVLRSPDGYRTGVTRIGARQLVRFLRTWDYPDIVESLWAADSRPDEWMQPADPQPDVQS